MNKYFKTNQEYFRFLNKYKDKINIQEVKILKTKIKIVYDNIN